MVEKRTARTGYDRGRVMLRLCVWLVASAAAVSNPLGAAIGRDTTPVKLQLLQARANGKSIDVIVQTRNGVGEAASVENLRMTADVDGRLVPLGVVQDEQDVAIVLLVDNFGSLAPRPKRDAETLINMLILQLGPRDRMAILSSASGVRTLAGFTSDRNTLMRATDELSGTDRASNRFAGLARANAMANSPDSELPIRRVIVNVTTGVAQRGDDPAEALDAMSTQSVPVYGMLLDSDGMNRDTSAWGSLVSKTQGAIIPVHAGGREISFARLKDLMDNSYHYTGTCDACGEDSARLTMRVRTQTQDASLISAALSVAREAP